MLQQELTPADAITSLALILRSVQLTDKQVILLDESLRVLNVMVQSYSDTSFTKTITMK